jgi:putative transposase
VMPDHVHALVWFPKTDQLTKFIHEWKRLSSCYVREWYRRNAPNYVVFVLTSGFWRGR